MSPSVTLKIKALRHNVKQTKTMCHSLIMAVIKANAYGHGIKFIANALTDLCDAFAVARLDEAKVLTDQGIINPILILQGFTSLHELTQCINNNYWVTLHHAYQIKILQQIRLKKPLHIWLKLDTGMHRLGIPIQDATHIITQLKQNTHIKLTLMSHMASADDPNNRQTKTQIQRFQSIAKHYKYPQSIANSAALIAWQETHLTWVRPGIMLYGIHPMQNKSPPLNLKPVMTLKAPIIAIQHYKLGDKIGYGGSWVCQKNMRIAVIGIGYGDGYPRHAPTGTPILVKQQYCPLLGKVSMDLISIDVKDLNVSIGDEVTLWGEGIPIELIAQYCNTIGYELSCKVTERVTRKYL